MLFLNSLLKTQLHLDLLIQLWFLDVQLESSITATQYQHNQLTKNKSENIVKMSLSNVKGLFQFSKITLDKSKEPLERLHNGTFSFSAQHTIKQATQPFNRSMGLYKGAQLCPWFCCVYAKSSSMLYMGRQPIGKNRVFLGSMNEAPPLKIINVKNCLWLPFFKQWRTVSSSI